MVTKARNFIRKEYANPLRSRKFWIEKTVYKSSLLQAVYCSAALHSQSEEIEWSRQKKDRFATPDSSKKHMKLFLTVMPSLQLSEPWCLDLISIETKLLANRLHVSRESVFPRYAMPMTEDKYLQFIPLIWVACNHLSKHVLSLEVVWEMTVLSMLNYQADELIESLVSRLSEASLRTLKSSIRISCGLFDGTLLNPDSQDNGQLIKTDCPKDYPARKRQRIDSPTAEPSSHVSLYPDPVLHLVESSLKAYVVHILQHPLIVTMPVQTRSSLASELNNFLMAHIAHTNDNAAWKLARQENSRSFRPARQGEASYYRWLQATGADDTSCPFSFLFFLALAADSYPLNGASISRRGARIEYLLTAVSRHLAAMCRQYNDYGSLQRDREEGNVNSLDFAEFSNTNRCVVSARTNGENSNGAATSKTPTGEHREGAVDSNTDADVELESKAELLSIAQYERECMELALKGLEEARSSENGVGSISERELRSLRAFVNVTDAFGKPYVQKDLASRLLKQDA